MNAQVSNADSPSGGPAVPTEPTPGEHIAPTAPAELTPPAEAELAAPAELAELVKQTGPAGSVALAEQNETVPVEPSLPEPVRQRVVVLAATVLGGLALDELPAALRKVAKFAPNRRHKLGGAQIATQLSTDPVFRQRVAAKAVAAAGELGAEVAAGRPPAAADPVEIAALAYLARPTNWIALVADAGQEVRVGAGSAAIAELVRDAEQQVARAGHDRAVARVEADKLRDELSRLREEAAGLRDTNRALSRALREAQSREKRASELLATERGRLNRTNVDHEAEVRRLRGRLADAEAAAGANRQAASQARQADDARLWLLLETIGQAASGLRRELALRPASVLPADLVAAEAAQRPDGQAVVGPRALDADDPARLDQLLGLPKAHLVVDGYNVTKSGFGEISLEQQRGRLISGLGGLAAQTGAEVTVVFDGAERLVGLPPAPRRVRVLFSRKGETADELIRRLVRAEPPGRPIVVISSDREVVDGVRRHGAYPLSSGTLLRRLARV
jgi:predicted RNA-binding protein with PIN domain